MTKVSVVGGGNAGCITALYLSWFKRDLEVELIYNPDIPCERVGQATVLEPPKIFWAATGFNWYHNPIHATFKSGVCMKDGVMLMKKCIMDSLLMVWQCIFVLGKCRSMF